MVDLRAKTRGQLDGLEKVMLRIPLYRGYKEKELRRESDYLLRTHTYQNLLNAKQDLKKKQSKFIENNNMTLAKQLDKIIVLCDTVAERINHAEGGYSGFWDAVKIKEKELDQMYEFDVKVSLVSEETKIYTKELVALAESKEKKIQEFLSLISEKLESLGSMVDSRTHLLNGYGEA